MAETGTVAGGVPGAQTAWRWSPPRDTWLVRLFDYTPFLAALCLFPAVGLLVVFLTYPLGLGVFISLVGAPFFLWLVLRVARRQQ